MNQIPDFILDALQNPSLRQSEEFLNWLKEDEQNRVLFTEWCDYHEAGRRMLSENNPDVELQWKRVQEKQREEKRPFRLRNFRIAAISAAASLVIFFLANHFYSTEEQENISDNIEWILSDIPVKEDAIIVVKAISKVQPVLLTIDKKNTISIYDKVLDYTKKKETKVATEMLSLTTPRGKSIKILLSDGTEVWLNAESRLTYPSYFTDSTRTVELKGEAYFKVAKDSIHPFIVKHDGVTTQALGTAFNIRSYANENKHVTLVEGSVLVSDKSQSQEHRLLPGQDAEYNTSSSITVKEVNVREYTAWTEDLFYFEQTKLMDIMQILGRWYNTTVFFEEEETGQYHFTFWAECKGSLIDTLALLNKIGTVKAYWDSKNNRVIIKRH